MPLLPKDLVRLQVASRPGAGDWNRTSDLRFTNFTNSNLRQSKPTRNNKRGCSWHGSTWGWVVLFW